LSRRLRGCQAPRRSALRMRSPWLLALACSGACLIMKSGFRNGGGQPKPENSSVIRDKRQVTTVPLGKEGDCNKKPVQGRSLKANAMDRKQLHTLKRSVVRERGFICTTCPVRSRRVSASFWTEADAAKLPLSDPTCWWLR
jgi:hypothetical protein